MKLDDERAISANIEDADEAGLSSLFCASRKHARRRPELEVETPPVRQGIVNVRRKSASLDGDIGRNHPRILITASVLALASCSTPATRTVTVEVDKPVAVQPIKPADVPKAPAPLGPRPQSLSAAADTLLSKVCEWVAYGLRADPLLRASAGENQAPLPKYPECEH